MGSNCTTVAAQLVYNGFQPHYSVGTVSLQWVPTALQWRHNSVIHPVCDGIVKEFQVRKPIYTLDGLCSHLEMEWSVPYRSDLQLASILDKNLLKVGECLKRGEESLTINKTEICYSMSTSLKEVCTLLRIPPEYALKVKAEEIKDGLVASCIESLHCDNTFSIIFRVSYLQVCFVSQLNCIELNEL
ncbi:hypothetical protein Btru_067774 [Bulinus truncatus]|nr:hypothetical protein Btru_067774 [Bulinus truncatus]